VHLVVGGSDVGIGAALRARELDSSAEVTVVVADGYPNFGICGIPYYVSGDVRDWRDLADRTRDDLVATGMRLRLNTSATHIDASGQRLTVVDEHGRGRNAGLRRVVAADVIEQQQPAAGAQHPVCPADREAFIGRNRITPARTPPCRTTRRRPVTRPRDPVRPRGAVRDPRHITGFVDALQASGFVERRPHPSDRRAVSVELTEHGADTARWMTSSRRRSARAILGNLSSTDLAAFVRVADRILGQVAPTKDEEGSE
jgi:MarR family protein